MKPSYEIRLICKELSNGNWFDVGLVRQASACVIGDGWPIELTSRREWTSTNIQYPDDISPQKRVDIWHGNGRVVAKLIDGLVKYRFVK